MRAQHKRIADELRDLKFAPEICPRSRELAAVSAPGELAARTEAMIRRRKLRTDRTRQETAQAQMAHVTFKPDLATPCVCGRGTGVVPVDAEKKDHTTFCNNFMRACAAVNANRAASKVDGAAVSRITGAGRADAMAKYDQYKRIRARQRRDILQEVEDRELTFSPQINANSLAVRACMRVCARTLGQDASGFTPRWRHAPDTCCACVCVCLCLSVYVFLVTLCVCVTLFV